MPPDRTPHPRPAHSQLSAEAILDHLGEGFRSCTDVGLEFSVRLLPGRIGATVRFGCWVNAPDAPDLARVSTVLHRFQAPDRVRRAHAEAVLPVRQGIAVAFGHQGAGFRLYLHGRETLTRADRYTSWRWTAGGDVRRSEYEFHFLPESPSGLRPLDLVPSGMRSAFTALLGDHRLRWSSGFWLRRDESGRVDQLDLAFPWSPDAGSLIGVRQLAQVLAVPTNDFSRIRTRV